MAWCLKTLCTRARNNTETLLSGACVSVFRSGRSRQHPIHSRAMSTFAHQKFQKLVYTSPVKNYHINNLEMSSDISEACRQLNRHEACCQDIHERFRRSSFDKDVLTANRFLFLWKKNMHKSIVTLRRRKIRFVVMV